MLVIHIAGVKHFPVTEMAAEFKIETGKTEHELPQLERFDMANCCGLRTIRAPGQIKTPFRLRCQLEILRNPQAFNLENFTGQCN
jgi:hypothetical protein